MKTSSKLYSILFLKCPKCHKGRLLTHHPYRLIAMNKVNDRCDVCDQKFKLEPSFFYGSMYVSYAIGVAVAVGVFVLGLILGLQLSMLQYFLAISAVLLIMMPYIGALAKSVWAHFFIKYNPEIRRKPVKNSSDS